MIGPAESLLRVMAIVGKELVEVIRRPGALLSLVLGPFLIMAVFGFGYDGVRRPLDTVIVIPAGSGLSGDAQAYQDLAGGAVRIVAITPDRASAEADLRAGRVDLVVVAPVDPKGTLRSGQQSRIEVIVDATDPIAVNYAGFVAAGLSSAVNREVITEVASEGRDLALSGGDTALASVPPELVAAPTKAEVVNLAPSQPGVLGFYGPAVLALLLEHLAVTLIALSLVRERTTGLIELFRVAPVSSGELLAGKLIAYAVVGGIIAATTIGLLVYGLHVPMLGDPAMLVAAIGALLLASLGVGMLIAGLSDSERQVVQLSLLLLLASVFFSGFVLAVNEFTIPVQALASLLPVTHGIRLVGDVMLRGGGLGDASWAALAAISLVSILGAWALLRRSMRTA